MREKLLFPIDKTAPIGEVRPIATLPPGTLVFGVHLPLTPGLVEIDADWPQPPVDLSAFFSA
jgi:hypothetical protein